MNSEPKEDMKIWEGGNTNEVDIFCPTIEIGLIDLSKKGGEAKSAPPLKSFSTL